MKRKILSLVLLGFFISGCASLGEKERIIDKGTLLEKINYLENNLSTKEEVLEFLGPPDSIKKFSQSVAIWYYSKNVEEPVEIIFGQSGDVLRIDTKSAIE